MDHILYILHRFTFMSFCKHVDTWGRARVELLGQQAQMFMVPVACAGLPCMGAGAMDTFPAMCGVAHFPTTQPAQGVITLLNFCQPGR